MSDHPSLAFRDNPLDRCANQRSNADWLARQYASPRLRTVRLLGDKVAMDGDVLAIGPGDPQGLRIFLGRDADGDPWAVQPAADTDTLSDLRSLMLDERLPSWQLSLLAQARSLLHWHQRHGFCANCGRATDLRDGGYRRHCGACTTEHFPRTDPVIIIAVTRPGFVLLGRQESWPPGMFSTLAGFMEPGETIEDAARREVFEEAGIRVGAVSYVASQPWPFPASLMIGLTGEALSEEIVIDPKELQEARWFAHDELRLMVDRTHPQGLWASRPQAIAHTLVKAALAG